MPRPFTQGRIIALVGLTGSGKSTSARLLHKSTSWPVIYFGASVIEAVRRRGLALNEHNESLVREELRDKHGMSAVAELALPKLVSAVETSGSAVIDSIYCWAEAELVANHFSENFTLVGVHAARSVREKRVDARLARPLSTSELLSRDMRQIAALDQATPLALADFHVVNDGTEEHLHDSLRHVLGLD